ncbi:MAG: DnaJ domain-containing protein [Hyphomicrobiales bacterium]
MSRILIAIAFVFIAIPLALIAFLKAQPAQMASGARVLGGGVLLAIGTLLSTRGLALLGGPLALFGMFMLAKGFGFSRSTGGARRTRKTEGQTSHVRTSMLDMELDHDSGSMDGMVLSGVHTERRLSELEPAELMQVMEECIIAEDQSQVLLEAYLDRHHPEWREATGRGDESAPAGSSGPMTSAEALDILGLDDSAHEDDIRKAHRELMKKYHPDHGGSDYLAARINEAKDTLLGE